MSQNNIELGRFSQVWMKIRQTREDATQTEKELQRLAVKHLRGEIDDETLKKALAESEFLKQRVYLYGLCEHDLHSAEKRLQDAVSRETLYGHISR